MKVCGVLFLFLSTLLMQNGPAAGFTSSSTCPSWRIGRLNAINHFTSADKYRPNQRRIGLKASSSGNDKSNGPSPDEDQGNDDKNKKNPNLGSTKSIMEQAEARYESIHVEKAREKLETANTQSFLKRKPRKLPYNDARRWVQGNLGCDSKEEFDDLVANGNLRTPYIPKNPESYYTSTREWISWDHFLTGCFDGSSPSAVQPKTGVFD